MPWAQAAVAIDAKTTSVPIGADTAELVLGILAWIPAGVDYELRGIDEFLGFVRKAAGRTACAAG
ncbi:MAG: hypothetical protein ABI053_06310 [Lacisediminihabitans sp.]